MMTPVYLDYNSTTPVDEQVLQAMLPFFTKNFGNASNRTHAYGWIAEEAVKIARNQVADLSEVLIRKSFLQVAPQNPLILQLREFLKPIKIKGITLSL